MRITLFFVCTFITVCMLWLVVPASRYDYAMILGQRLFNPSLRLHHTLAGDVLSFEEMCKFNSDRAQVESVFETQSRLQRLRLTDEENCMLAAFTVMTTGTDQHWFH